jgi:hypothetical protein
MNELMTVLAALEGARTASKNLHDANVTRRRAA